MSAECTWVKGHLAPLIDKELSSEDRARAERHLAACAACRAALERLKELDQIDREALWRSEFQEAGARKTDQDAPRGVKPGSSRDDEDPADALMRSVRSRFDLESAKRHRQREREELDGTRRSDREAARVAKREAKGGATLDSERAAKRDAERDATLDTARGARASARYLPGEDVADLPLEESLHRRRADGTAHERAAGAAPVGHADRDGREGLAARKQDAASAQPRKSWLQRFADLWPKPSSHAVWLPLAGGTAAVAVLVMLLTARDTDRAREAIQGSVRGDVPTELDVSEGARRSPENLMENHAGHDAAGSGADGPGAAGSVDTAVVPGSGEKGAGTAKLYLEAEADEMGASPQPAPDTPSQFALMKETQSPAVLANEALSPVEETSKAQPPAALSGEAPAPAPPRREEWSRDEAALDAPAADKPGWHQALGNLLRILDRPEPSGAEPAVVRLEQELIEAEQMLAQQMAEGGAELWQAPTLDRRSVRAPSDQRTLPPPDEVRTMMSAPGSGAVLPAVIQAVVDGIALPQTEHDAQAYWAVAEGWYALWQDDPESHERASHAARYYGALRLGMLEQDLSLTGERDVLLTERLSELETALAAAESAPPKGRPLPVRE